MMFEERVTTVTGGAQGIGLAIARELAHRGARVAVADLDATVLEAVAAELAAAGHDTVPLAADVAVEDDVATAVSAVERRWGRLDHVINRAGIDRPARLPDLSAEHDDRVTDVDLEGVHPVTSAALPLLARGGGAVVDVAQATAFLCSDGAAFIAGATPTVDGGVSTQLVEP